MDNFKCGLTTAVEFLSHSPHPCVWITYISMYKPTVDNVTAKTNRLNGVDKRPDRLLLHTILRVDGIDDLYMLQECSRDEPALEDTLARIMVL